MAFVPKNLFLNYTGDHHVYTKRETPHCVFTNVYAFVILFDQLPQISE